MDFGKINNLDGLTLTLPPDHAATYRVLKTPGTAGYLKPKIYIGGTSWANKEWRVSYYPAIAQTIELLHWYSQKLNTVELNLTHYYIPDDATVQRWRETVTPNFVFCPKLPKLISHELQLHQTEITTRQFCQAVAGLGDFLGTCFLQLPPSFSPDEANNLIYYLENFPKNISLGVELRHPDWFRDSLAANMVFETMEALGITSVITDVAGRRDVLHQRLTTSTAFIRFNGYQLHPSDFSRLDDWVTRIATWLNNGLQTLYFFIHQENSLHVPVLANYLIQNLNTACNLELELCKPILQPVQGKLF